MPQITTVLGQVDTRKMGFTLMHEHILISSAGIKDTFPSFVPRKAAIAEAVRRFTEAKSEGIETVVDLTTMDLGRDIRAIEYVSRATGVQVIAATGTWLEIPRAFRAAEPDDIAPLYISEIRDGIEGTGIRAGVIKVANDVGGVTKEGEVVLRAAARAQKATGVPIITHTWAPERVGEQQARIFESEGLDPAKVCIGHSNDTTDLDYLTGLLKRGYWLGMDRFPSRRPDVPDWKQRSDTIKALIDAGWGHRVMVSHDDPITLLIQPKAQRAERFAQNPDHICFIKRRVLPYLREAGVAEEKVRALVFDNPRTFFGG